jgi:transposase
MKLHANAKLTPSARLLLCRRITREGRSLPQAAEAAGVSERTARKWLSRYRTEGPGALPIAPAVPAGSPAAQHPSSRGPSWRCGRPG